MEVEWEYVEENGIKTSNSQEIRINCLSCNDNGHHVYINIYKESGWCHKCHEVYVLKGYVQTYRIKKKKKFSGKLPEGAVRVGEGGGRIEKEVIKYLYSRGLNEKDFEKYDIHYGVGGKFHKRVIFPFVYNNELIYYSSRSIDPNAERKTLNPYGQTEVFNLEEASEYRSVVVVEGIFDAILTGYDAVAVLGKNITQHQAEIMAEYGIRDIHIMLDSEVSMDDSMEVAHKIKKYFRSVTVIELPLADPADLRLREIRTSGAWKSAFNEIEYNFAEIIGRIQLRW